MKTDFLGDIQDIQKHARQRLEDGAVTKEHQLNVQQMIDVMNDCLATELLCVSRYKSHHYKALCLGEHQLANEFLEHATEEQRHADMLAIRIDQLGGVPNFNPENVTHRSHCQYDDADGIMTMIVENLIAERTTISTYRKIIQYVSDDDPTTRRMIELLLEKEEEHADDLLVYLYKYKNKNERSNVIDCLKETAESLAHEISDGGIIDKDQEAEEEINTVVNLLNSIDRKNHYTRSDFVSNM